MDSLPIMLPAEPAPPRRAPVPFMAAVVPIAAGVVLWLVTGSLYALCFAALGPLMIAASIIDGARGRRRDRRRAAVETEKAWAKVERELERAQQEERMRRRHRHPDAASCLLQSPLRGSSPPDAATELVVGTGVAPSGIRTGGGEGERARAFQERCANLPQAPVMVPLGRGVCLRGAEPIIAAAARAFVVQLCLRFSAAQLSLVGGHELRGLSALPHAVRAKRSGFRLGIASAADDRVESDALIWLTVADGDVPDGITTVIDVVEPARAVLRTPHGIAEIAVECLSLAQAQAIATTRADEGEDDALPELVGLHELSQVPSTRGLPAVIGRGERGEIVVDIVEDGPHAIVTGTTGTGKSELLVTWVTALAAANGPDRVTFVLADFKGGTAFEPLRDLPQVAAVITDLDEEGARRGVSSLTAELRRREAVLAAAGVRDVREVAMPRLIIVVDEFAALVQEHPDLGAVFTDVAARGRALGMHLILGTQRASGVIRDALAANCPLRLSLRVGDPADSRLVIGTDAAAELPGGPVSRGLGLVRRPEDLEPVAFRVAMTCAADLRAAGVRWGDSEPPLSPWLPALPTLLPLTELQPPHSADGVVLGRVDAPELQSQPLEILHPGIDRGLAIIGAPGSGRTAALRTLAAQTTDAVWVPRDPEGAWDVTAAWASGTEAIPRLVLCDDLDGLVADYPPEHAQHFTQLWEQILRGSAGSTIVVTSARPSGAIGRVIDALPRRALLRMSSRVEHLAAGGEPAGYVRDRAPGRARIGDREAQIAWVDEASVKVPDVRPTRFWNPDGAVTAVVTGAAPSVAEAIRLARPSCHVTLVGAESVSPTPTGILVADAETWQRNWSLWQRCRDVGEVLVRAEHPSDLRQLAGVRELPPFARAHAGRAWSLRNVGSPRRVVIPEIAPRAFQSTDAVG